MPKTTHRQSDIQPRLDRLPWSRWHVRVVFALGFAWRLDSLEANIIGSVLGILQEAWRFTPLQGSLTVSVWLVGIMVGAVMFGYLSDRIGRKRVFFLTLLWYRLFTAACAFSADIWTFIVLRFLAALGIGGEYAAISSAVVEFIPRKVRGRADAFILSLWPVGALCSALLVAAALQFFPPAVAWRAGFLLAVVLALFALYVRRNVPESPQRFLGGLTSVLMVDTIGRKLTGVVAFGSCLIACLSLIFVTSTFSAVVSLCIMQYCYTWGWVMEYVIKSEIFPTRSRAAATGWATFFGRTGGIITAPVLTGGQGSFSSSFPCNNMMNIATGC